MKYNLQCTTNCATNISKTSFSNATSDNILRHSKRSNSTYKVLTCNIQLTAVALSAVLVMDAGFIGAAIIILLAVLLVITGFIANYKTRSSIFLAVNLR